MDLSEQAIGEQVREAICRSMGQTVSSTGDIYLQIPAFFPTGAGSVVRIRQSSKRFHYVAETFSVDDAGAGYSEAEAVGVNRAYARQARLSAERFGAHFEGRKLGLTDITRQQLPWACMSVASLSIEALSVAMQRADDARRAADADILVEKLKRYFPKAAVSKDAEVLGSSNTKWHVDALLDWSGRRAVFEAVSAHHASIFAAVTKLGDLKALDNSPARVAVVKAKDELKTYQPVLSRVCAIVEREAAVGTYAGAAGIAD